MKLKIFFAAALISLMVCITSNTSEAARMLFTGDIMTHYEQIAGARRGDGYDFIAQFIKVAPVFKKTFTVAALETVLAGRDAGFSGYPLFNSPDELADAIARAGIDAVTLANNHILDMGAEGVKRTMKTLEARGIRHVGASLGQDVPSGPLIIDIDGVRTAISNFTYGTNVQADPEDDVKISVIHEGDIIKALERSRAISADIIAMCLHWGGEYADKPGAAERDLADLCIQNGADIVIGTHPHRLQQIETRVRVDGRAAVIAWSLGNLISSQHGADLGRGAILAVDTAKDENGTAHISRVSVLPTVIMKAPPGFGAARMTAPLNTSVSSADKDSDGFITLWHE